MTLHPVDWIAALVIGGILLALAVDAWADGRTARVDRALLDAGHDVEYAPAAGRLLHLSGCWCRPRSLPCFCWQGVRSHTYAADCPQHRHQPGAVPPPRPVPHPMTPGRPPADFED